MSNGTNFSTEFNAVLDIFDDLFLMSLTDSDKENDKLIYATYKKVTEMVSERQELSVETVNNLCSGLALYVLREQFDISTHVTLSLYRDGITSALTELERNTLLIEVSSQLGISVAEANPANGFYMIMCSMVNNQLRQLESSDRTEPAI